MAGHAVSPGYRRDRPRTRPKLDAHAGFIDEILKSDLTAPRKQRHTILRLFERLRDERGFDGGYTTVRDYVRPRRLAFAPDGAFLTDFGGKGTGPDQVDHAIAVAVAANGSVFVADFLNNRSQMWQPRR
jgi:hypothetical protein